MSSTTGSGNPPATSSGEGGSSNPRSDQCCRNKNHWNTNRETKFEGKCADIKTSIYDVLSGKDTFAKTTREIAEYVRCKFEDAGEFRTGMVEMKLPALTEPAAPTGNDNVNFELWKMAHCTYEQQIDARHCNLHRVYALVLGQCSQALRNRMEASETWNALNEASDVMKLLQLIQNCMIQCQTHQKPVHSLLDAESQASGGTIFSSHV